MNGETLLAEAIEMKDEIVENRRAIHRAPEVGAHLPQTVQFVEEKLRLLGYEPRELGGGVVAELTGEDTGRCILLRADMDALRVREKTDLPFRSENGSMHACGHDMHAAMLLGAARLLKAHQSELKGTVKLVFQPDEEGFTGAKAMLKAGVLEAPKPQAAMALHVNSGTPSGLVLCGKGTFMAGCTLFRITVKGVGCHGAMPETGVDPINIAAHIYLALQEITARELPAKTPAIVTMGKFSAGHAPNIIPQEAVIEGTIRTFDRDVTALILRRIGEIADATARAFRGSASVEELASAHAAPKCCSARRASTACMRAGWARRTLRPTPTSCRARICCSARARRRRTCATESPCTTRASSSTRTFYRAGAHCSPMARCSGLKIKNKKIRLRIS